MRQKQCKVNYECQMKDCFKINNQQRIKMQKKVNKLDSKIMKEK